VVMTEISRGNPNGFPLFICIFVSRHLPYFKQTTIKKCGRMIANKKSETKNTA
jgi:hypothetical protein